MYPSKNPQIFDVLGVNVNIDKHITTIRQITMITTLLFICEEN